MEIYQENCRKYRMISLLIVPSVGQWSFLLFWVVINAEMQYCSVCGKQAIVCLIQRGNMFVIPSTQKKARKEHESCKLGRRAMKCWPHPEHAIVTAYMNSQWLGLTAANRHKIKSVKNSSRDWSGLQRFYP